MFRSLLDHHQGVQGSFVKVTELKYEYSCVVTRQHNIQSIYVMFGVVRCADCTPHHTKHYLYTITTNKYSNFNSVTLTRNP
jgi:hypothetical protein